MGVNRSGTEYRCIQGNAIFDGPNDQASISAMLTWKVNAVRIPLNEDCWLGINTRANSPSSTSYQQAIIAYADLLLQNGIYPIVELHWTAPGATQATRQYPMPDTDHSVAFWKSVATTFASQPKVIFELFNEPYPDSNMTVTAAWTCWRDGGNCPNLVLSNGGGAVSYQVAGMQMLLDAVRGAGANNFVLLGGVQFSNDLSQWVAFAPTDSVSNFGAAWHVYDTNACRTTTCYGLQGGAVAAKYPIVATEIGGITPGSTCDANGATFITTLMGWLDSPVTSSGTALPAQNYLAWAWNTNSNPHIVSDYAGTPFCYGSTYQTHLQTTPH
jgi:endoglucanase